MSCRSRQEDKVEDASSPRSAGSHPKKHEACRVDEDVDAEDSSEANHQGAMKSRSTPPRHKEASIERGTSTTTHISDDSKLSCGAVSVVMSRGGSTSNHNSHPVPDNNKENTPAKAIAAPPNSPATNRTSWATMIRGDIVASLDLVVRSLREGSLKGQEEPVGEALDTSSLCSQREHSNIGHASESASASQDQSQDRGLHSPKTSNETKKWEVPSSGFVHEGPSSSHCRRSARLAPSRVESSEAQKNDLRVVLAVVEVRCGLRLRIISNEDHSNEMDLRDQGRRSKQDSLASGSNLAAKAKKMKRPFPVLVHQLVTEGERMDPSIIRWEHDGAAFSMDSDHPRLPSLLAKYFQHQNYQSFRRQLHTYGWRMFGRNRKSKYKVFNLLFHRDKSETELSMIYRGYITPSSIPYPDDRPVVENYNTSSPRRSRRSSATTSQESHCQSSEMKPPTTKPPDQGYLREVSSSTGSAGVEGGIEDMPIYSKNNPHPVKEEANETREDMSPIRIHPLVEGRVGIQVDSQMLTPKGRETIFNSDHMRNHHLYESARNISSGARWRDFSRLNSFATIREVDEISDLTGEAPIRASEIFCTPSASYLHDQPSAFPLYTGTSLSLPTIKPSCSRWDSSTSAAKGVPQRPSEGLAPIIETLDAAFKAAAPRYKGDMTTPGRGHPTKPLFSITLSDETSSAATSAVFRGACAQFSPLVPRFNPSGWAVLLPEISSRHEQCNSLTGKSSIGERHLPSPANLDILRDFVPHPY